jgi:tRNA nucleotidyltransferase (CCA-adding enzyme)
VRDKIGVKMSKRNLLPDEVSLFPEKLREIFQIFQKNGFEIYLVGAGVRNILTDKMPVNCDLTTDAVPEETQKILKDVGYEPYYDNEFGMVGVPVNENEVYEITTYRSEEGYSDFRRPDKVVWGKSLEEDVKRRDFTMNAVVIGEKKEEKGYELIDLVDGLADFEAGIIRTVGEAEQRFSEDALRMMRAIRFAATLSFQIEEKTLSAISKKAPLLSKISRERVRDELWKILKSNYPADGMRLLISTGLMEYIIPEVLAANEVEQTGHHTLDVLQHMLESLRYCPSSDPIVKLAAFLHDVGKPKAKRWRCKKCGTFLKEADLKDGEFVCPVCHVTHTEKQATTFYGHEVVGAKMVAEIADRLRLTNKEKEKILILVRWHMFAYQPEMTDAAIRRFIRRVGKDNINEMMAVRVGDRMGGGSRETSWRLEELKKRIEEQFNQPITVKDMVVDGHDVMEILGITPGPKIGETLNLLFEEVIEDTSKNNREYLLSRIKEMVK